MSAITKIIFYNSFWNKKIPNGTGSQAITSYWPGLDWDPVGYPSYPNGMTLNAVDNQWMIEESRIVGGYNNTQNEIGVQAFFNETEITQRHRFNSLIYSGVYNNTTGVNETNVFSVAKAITKSIEPSYGFIKKTQSSSSNMIIFQENKVSQALIDKDVTYTSEDGTTTSPPGVVLGQVIPYAGNFGIGCNPESFAVFGRRKYFADPYRGSVLRLSNDGLTEISKNGMQDFFRDELQKISCNNKSLYYFLQTSQVTGALDTGIGVLTSSITQNTSTATLTGTNVTATYTCSNPNASGAVINIDVGSGEVSTVSVDQIGGTGYQVGNTITIPKSFLGGVTDVIITLVAGDIGVGPSSTIPFTLAGTDPMGNIRIGMLASIQQTNGSYLDTGAYVISVSYTGSYSVTLSKPVTLTGGTTGSKSSIKFSMPVRDKIIGGWDIYDRTYVLSLQQWDLGGSSFSQNYKTLTYDETVAGWNSFYTYKPSNIFSLKNNFLTTFEGGLWKHHDNSVINNRGNFYGEYNSSYVDFIFNQNPSTKKVFQTISYEGDNGFKISRYSSDLQGVDPDLPLTSPNNYSLDNQYQDVTKSIISYDEGLYIDPLTGQPLRAGFDRKENLYTANLVNNSTVRPGEVIFGNTISGIKGYFATVKVETDNSTDLGGAKELWSVGTKIVRSS